MKFKEGKLQTHRHFDAKFNAIKYGRVIIINHHRRQTNIDMSMILIISSLSSSSQNNEEGKSQTHQ